MSVLTLCALLTFAATPPAGPPPKLALPALNVVGIEPQLATFYAEHFANQMKLEGIELITQNEIASLMGVERQRQLLGCTSQSAECMLELSNALGVDGLVLGGMAKVGTGVQVNLKVVLTGGKTVGVFSEFVADPNGVIAALNRAATGLSSQTARGLGRTLISSTVQLDASPSSGGGTKKWWWVPTAGGAVAAGVGVALLISGGSAAGAFTDSTKAPLPYDTAKSIAASGSAQQTAGVVLLCVGAAGAASGLALLLFGSESSTTVSFVPSSNPTLLVGGSF